VPLIVVEATATVAVGSVTAPATVALPEATVLIMDAVAFVAVWLPDGASRIEGTEIATATTAASSIPTTTTAIMRDVTLPAAPPAAAPPAAPAALETTSEQIIQYFHAKLMRIEANSGDVWGV